MINVIKGIFLNLILLNTKFIVFLFNYSSDALDQVIALSVLLLPFEIVYIVFIILGIVKRKNKILKIFNIIVFFVLLFTFTYNRIKGL